MLNRLATIAAASLCAGAAAATQPDSVAGTWPTATPERVASTPDWSDYRIYPAAARRRDQEGAVSAQLLIDTQGRPAECRIVQSSGFAELDAGTCDLMMTMRFQPAHDVGGAALASTFQRRIAWVLDSARPLASSSITIAARRQDSRFTCKVLQAQGAYAGLWSVGGCSILSDTGYFLHAARPTDAQFILVVRLDAGDNDPLLRSPWPDGTPIAAETVSFTVNRHGNPVGCTASAAFGWGPRGLNNLSPCGRFVSSLWLAKASDRRAVAQMRVYAIAAP